MIKVIKVNLFPIRNQLAPCKVALGRRAHFLSRRLRRLRGIIFLRSLIFIVIPFLFIVLGVLLAFAGRLFTLIVVIFFLALFLVLLFCLLVCHTVPLAPFPPSAPNSRGRFARSTSRITLPASPRWWT